MRIISTPLPAATEELLEGRPTVLMAFDTLANDKSLVVGITVGRLHGPALDDVALSEPGRLIVQRCGRHMQLNNLQGGVLVAGVAQVASAKQRVRQVLAQAAANSFVLLVCANGKVYDAAFPALGVDLQALNRQTQ